MIIVIIVAQSVPHQSVSVSNHATLLMVDVVLAQQEPHQIILNHAHSIHSTQCGVLEIRWNDGGFGLWNFNILWKTIYLFKNKNLGFKSLKSCVFYFFMYFIASPYTIRTILL